MTIVIEMEPGQHYIKKSYISEFNIFKQINPNIDFDHASFNLIIKSEIALCDQLMTSTAKQTCKEVGKATINNKVGS